jgi:hypothetical protein
MGVVMSYRLQYLDRTRKFIRSDRIHCDSDAAAVEVASALHLPVRSELWRGGCLVAKFPPHRQVDRSLR